MERNTLNKSMSLSSMEILNEKTLSDDNYSTEWFLNIKDVIHPKVITTLVDLWERHQLPKQYTKWAEKRQASNVSYKTYIELLGLGATTSSSPESREKCEKLLSSLSDLELFGIVHGIHM